VGLQEHSETQGTAGEADVASVAWISVLASFEIGNEKGELVFQKLPRSL